MKNIIIIILIVMMAGMASGDMTFIYSGWNSTEEEDLKNHVEYVYPLIEDLYGEPSKNILIDISKRPSSPMGYFNPIKNKIILPSFDLSLLTHEMTHAFHSNLLFSWIEIKDGLLHNNLHGNWEEGFATVIPCIIEDNCDQMVNDCSMYSFAIVWHKLYELDNDFFRKFNEEYYQTDYFNYKYFRNNVSEEELIKIGGEVMPFVNGQPFNEWFGQQEIIHFSKCDGVINDTELLAHIDQWSLGGLLDIELLSVIDYWSNMIIQFVKNIFTYFKVFALSILGVRFND